MHGTASPDLTAARGIVRLLNTSGGRLLCLAGEVDAAAVESFVRRYGREPMPVDAIDTGSVTRLSMPALDLVLDHLDAAERNGRAVTVRRRRPEGGNPVPLLSPGGPARPAGR